MTDLLRSCRLRGSTATLALALAATHPSIAPAQTTPADAASSPAVNDPQAATAPSFSGRADPAEASVESDGADIVVTARRRKEAAQDVPIALSVVSNEMLERAGDFNINQVQQLVPALQVTATNPRNSVITIRGLGANSSIAVDGLEYGVGFYLDGVYYGRPGQSQFDLMDLQQIEVLRGPQGTLFGKNTTAGAINATTRLPSFEPEFTGELWGGNYNFVQLRASASAPIIADKLAFRLTAAYTDRDGFLTNRFDGRDAQNYRNETIRAQLLAKPTEHVTVRLIGDYSRQRQHFALTIPDGYFSTYANGATIPNNIFDRAARTGYALLPGDAFRRKGDSDARFQANMASYGVSGEVNWDLHFATLTSITAYRWWDWNPANDVDGTSLSVNVAGQLKDRQRQFSQELRLASDGSHRIDYVIGAYYFWQVVRGIGEAAYGPSFGVWNFTAPTSTIANIAFNGFEADNRSDPETRSYAAFGQTDWHVTNRLTLTTGLRFTHEDKQGSYSQFYVSGVDPATLPAAQAAAVIALRKAFNPVLSFSAKDHANALTGLATLSYRITPDALVYATYSRGNKSGGLNLTQGGVFQPVVSPEKVNSYEVGLKTQFLDRKVTANAAAFWTEVLDYQTSITQFLGVDGKPGTFPSTTTSIQYITNIPKVRSRGLEADLSYVPSRWLSLSASGAYTDARYISFVDAPQAPELVNLGPIQNLSGKRLPNVPRFAYTLAADAAQPLGFQAFGDTIDVYGHTDWSHRSSYNSTATNSFYGVIPAYGILSLRLGLRTDNGHYDLSFFMKNALNEDYYISRSPSNYGFITALPGDPRTYGATLRVRF